MLDKEELRKRFSDFISKYRYGYFDLWNDDDFCWLENGVINYLEDNYIGAYENPMIGECIFQQIFSAIDALPSERNPYYQMMSRIEKEYGLERDIVDVSCGYYPALSHEILKRKKELGIEKGTITAIDPKLVVKTLDGINLVKDKFTLATPLPKDILLIGRKPCDATETIVRASSVKNLEFYIQLCGCEKHVPDTYKLSHKNTSRKKLLAIYIEELSRSTLPTGFSIDREEVQEKVGNGEKQSSIETVIKTKRMR